MYRLLSLIVYLSIQSELWDLWCEVKDIKMKLSFFIDNILQKNIYLYLHEHTTVNLLYV